MTVDCVVQEIVNIKWKNVKVFVETNGYRCMNRVLNNIGVKLVNWKADDATNVNHNSEKIIFNRHGMSTLAKFIIDRIWSFSDFDFSNNYKK